MPFNGSGSFQPPGASFPTVPNTLIESAKINAVVNDIATGLSNCVTRDGQSPATANLPMGGFRHTGVGSATARNHYATAGQIQDGGLDWVVAGGTADALTAIYVPTITALVDGQLCFARATGANATTTPTFAPNGLTAHTVTKLGGSALVASEWTTDQELILRYKLASTRWELLNPRAPTFTGGTLTSTLTMSGAAIDEAAYGTIAAATTTDLASIASNAVTVTGSSPITITSWGSLPSGALRTVRFTGTGAHVISQNANTNNITGANITVAQNDFCVIRGLGSGASIMEDFTRASGAALVMSTSPVVGSIRNLKVSVAPSAKTVTWTLDEIVVETALGGTAYKLASKTLAFAGAGTGANGMDTGSTPTSADLYIYCIAKADGTTACLGTISGSGASIYGGANMPSGYVASALIWAGKTDGSGNFVAFNQMDRRVWIATTNVVNVTSSVPTAFTSASASAVVPVNAKTVSGTFGTPAGTLGGQAIASDATGTAAKYVSGGTAAGGSAFDNWTSGFPCAPFEDLPMLTAQTLFYKGWRSDAQTRVDITGYTF